MTWWWKHYIFSYYRSNPMVAKASFTLHPNNLVIKTILRVILRIQRWRYYFPHTTLRTWRWRYHTAECYSPTGRAEQVPSISHVWHVPNVYTCIICRIGRTESHCKSGIKLICFTFILATHLIVNEGCWDSHSGKNSSPLDCLTVSKYLTNRRLYAFPKSQ
jgi:hypothetical protein